MTERQQCFLFAAVWMAASVGACSVKLFAVGATFFMAIIYLVMALASGRK